MLRIARAKNLNRTNLLVLTFSASFHLLTILRKFAWADDWAFISAYRTASAEVKFEHVSGLRPILQIVMDQTFGRVSEFESLYLLRLFSLVGLLVLSQLIMRHLTELEYSKSTVFYFGLLINFLPTFWIYTNWATVFIYSWVCVLSVISFNIFRHNKIVSIILSTICFLTYQPAAVFSAFLVFAYLLKKGRLERMFWLYLSSLITSSGLGFLLGKVIVATSNSSVKSRTEVIDSPFELAEKFFWVLTRPVLLSFRPFIVESRGFLTAIFTLICLSVALYSIWSIFKYKVTSLTDFLIGLFAVVVVGLLPVVVIKESLIEFRTLPTTSCMGLLLLISGFEQIKMKSYKFQFLPLLLIVVSIVSLTLYSQQKISEVFIQGFHKNNEYIKASYANQGFPEKIVVLLDSKPWPQRNYIGSLSAKTDLQMPWVPLGEVSQILGIREDQILIHNIDITQVAPQGNVIDLLQFRESVLISK